MKKPFKGLMLLLCLGAIVSSLSAKEVIKVGVVTPLSGDFAVLKELADVMRLRAEELGKNAESKYTYEYIFEDSRFDPKTSHLAATKLLKVDKVDVIVSIASLSAKVVQPLASREKVPHLILGGDELAEGEWNFSYFFTADDCLRLLASTAKAMGYQSYAMMGQRQEAGLIAVRAMQKAAKELGMEEKGIFLWNPTDSKDFRAHLLKAREAGPDFIVFFPTPPDPDILLKQRKELGVDIPMVGIESFDFVQEKSLIEGLWLAGCPLLTDAMKTKLGAMGITPSLPYDAYVYDFPLIIQQAVETAATKDSKKPTGEAIRSAMADIKSIDGMLGSAPADSEGAFHPAPVLIYYENGAGREVTLDELLKLKGKN